jgi:hypothetical protein
MTNCYMAQCYIPRSYRASFISVGDDARLGINEESRISLMYLWETINQEIA